MVPHDQLVVNNPLIRPYFLEGKRGIGGVLAPQTSLISSVFHTKIWKVLDTLTKMRSIIFGKIFAEVPTFPLSFGQLWGNFPGSLR